MSRVERGVKRYPLRMSMKSFTKSFVADSAAFLREAYVPRLQRALARLAPKDLASTRMGKSP